MKLLPAEHDQEHGWSTYIWLVYLGFFFLHPILDRVGRREWLATGLGTAIFLGLYFGFFWCGRPWKLLPIAGMVLLGATFAPWNPGSSSFFIYAACLVPFAVERERTAVGLLALILSFVGLEAWLLHLSPAFYLPAIFCSIFPPAANIFFAQRNRANRKLYRAQGEIERLAKTAER